jgi:hypothetical protein
MNPIASKNSWLIAPISFALGIAALIIVWATLAPQTCEMFFDNNGCSPFELMTLPLFALVVPLVWLCPPVGGSSWRKAGWSSIYSLLAMMALVREQDWHKQLFAHIWPEIASSFRGTVFKMRFIKADDIELMPKIFVVCFFILFFAAVLIPLIRYFKPLFKGFFKLDPVAWSMAFFGISGVMVQVFDRLPSKLRKAGCELSESTDALFTALEEGSEMLLALLALLAIVQAYFKVNCQAKPNCGQ